MAGKLLIFTIVLMLGAGLYAFIADPALHADEKYHFPQIQIFCNGNLQMLPTIATLPGYHLVSAAIISVFDGCPQQAARAVSFFAGAASIIVAFLIARKLHGEREGLLKMAQFAAFPLLFPLFFLIYTDALSVLFMLTSFYFMLERKPSLSGIAAILGVLVRQGNIFWLIFILLYGYLNEKSEGKKSLARYAGEKWVFIAGIAMLALLAPLIVSSQFAASEREMHPLGYAGLGNIFFLLAIFFFLFLPANIRSILEAINNHDYCKKITLALLLAIFAAYMLTFSNTHPYNHNMFFLHNQILAAMTSSALAKALAFLPIALSLLAISRARLSIPNGKWFYVIAALSLIPAWMIEQRYAIVPLAFFIVLRKPESERSELLTLALFISASIIATAGIIGEKFFP